MKRRGKLKKRNTAVPDRKISETLLDFADPLLELSDYQYSTEELTRLIQIAIMVWNAVVMETWENEGDYLAQIHSKLGQSDLQPIINLLEKRKRQHFGEDLRAVGHFGVIEKQDGEFALRATAHMRDSLREIN